MLGKTAAWSEEGCWRDGGAAAQRCTTRLTRNTLPTTCTLAGLTASSFTTSHNAKILFNTLIVFSIEWICIEKTMTRIHTWKYSVIRTSHCIYCKLIPTKLDIWKKMLFLLSRAVTYLEVGRKSGSWLKLRKCIHHQQGMPHKGSPYKVTSCLPFFVDQQKLNSMKSNYWRMAYNSNFSYDLLIKLNSVSEWITLIFLSFFSFTPSICRFLVAPAALEGEASQFGKRSEPPLRSS